MDPIDAFDKVWAAASKLKDLSNKVKEADIRMAIADLLMNAADLKVKIADLTEENLKLKLDLKKKVKQSEETIVHKPPFFYREGEDKPLCPKCWQEKQKTTYLLSEPWNNGTMYDCPVCQFKQVPKGLPVSRVVRMRR